MNTAKGKFSIVAAICLAALIVTSLGAAVPVQADEPLDSHGVIRVDGNAELALLVSSEEWNGTGTADYPYIIENLDIDAAGAGAAIYIGNTTSHVIIRDSQLHGAAKVSDPHHTGAGLLLYNAANVLVENVEAADNVYGIALIGSSQNRIEYNNASENKEYGIFLGSSDDNDLLNNSLSQNTKHGVYLSTSAQNTVYGNVFIGNNGATSEYDPAHLQAYDDGANYWNSSTYGNYWDDLRSPDLDRNGIVDRPYALEGGQDLYPLVVPSIEIEIISPKCCSTAYAPTVLVTGTSTPGYDIEVNGLLVRVGDDGKFSIVVALVEGDNYIKARSPLPVPSETDNNHVVYVNQLRQDLDDLNESLHDQIDDLEERLQGAQSQLDNAKSDLSTTKDDVSGLRDDSLPLLLGAVGLIVGLVAIALSFVLARRPKAP